MSQKYKGPISQAPPEIRAAVEARLGAPLPDDIWINVDLENWPERAELTFRIPQPWKQELRQAAAA